MRKARKPWIWAGIGLTVMLGLSACAPGSQSTAKTASTPVSTDVAQAGKVTLTVWDEETNSVKSTLVNQLNAEFEKKYPNVTISRVSRSFNDLKTTLKLALSGANPPDVVEVNQGYPDMGAYVQAGLLSSLNNYEKLYGWNKRFPAALLDINSFTPNGKTWNTGDLFGLSTRGEAVGVFYNKSILDKYGITPPTTYPEFIATLPKLKAAGVLPISYGDSDLTMGIHLYGVVQAALAGAKKVDDLVYGKGGAWTDPDNIQAARVVQQWAQDGYITPGANGISEAEATANFGNGQSAYEIDGPWEGGTLAQTMGSNVGFNALKPTANSSGPVTQGGISEAWSITSKSKHPNVAAAYINFLTSNHAMVEEAKVSLLPVITPTGYTAPAGTLETDLADAYNQTIANNGLVPYLDYSTPTFYDTITAAIQKLTAAQTTPEQFTQTLQADYSAFLQSRK